ncbi:MFS transporter [Chromatiaceae bacterium AAb-1]|nr:MFS transporter [Chromatiaceae bacterium AAb-1]
MTTPQVITATATEVTPAQPASSDHFPFVLPVIMAVAVAHLINDLIQAILPAIYPLIKESYDLTFTQIGMITLIFQLTASLLQPAIGLYTDKYPKPWLLPCGMLCTLSGIIMLSAVSSFPALLMASALTGIGSATFHPDASRIARMASGGRFGFAQSTFQVGGNTGSALGPLLAAAIIVPFGLGYVGWFALFAIAGLFILYRVSLWYSKHLTWFSTKGKQAAKHSLSPKAVFSALAVLAILVFSKYFYTASLTNYFTFFLMEKFDLTVAASQIYLFVFLGAVAAGTFFGGPVGDKIGRKTVIWFSILGVTPFTLLLPYADLFWTGVLSVLIGLIMSSAFSAIVVYAQELIPGKVGLITGIFFGLMFGFSGIAAAFLGSLADSHGIFYVYEVCAYLPLLGILAIFLPDTRKTAF